VTKPTVDILDQAGVEVTVGKQSINQYLLIICNSLTQVIAARRLEGAQKLAAGGNHTKAISLDVSDDAALDRELEKVDLVISLIPYTFHAHVIKGAIRTKKNVVTTSYVSPAMKELEAEAKKAGITVMNEIGLDPVSLFCSSFRVGC
jgi:saccharopine dehydrogenase (NADP+, L-glutamate forming)